MPNLKTILKILTSKFMLKTLSGIILNLVITVLCVVLIVDVITNQISLSTILSGITIIMCQLNLKYLDQ
jgi:hypothetical protein